MNDKFRITIRIAELKPFELWINSWDEEATIRTAEYNVNKLWRAWSSKFTNKTSHEVLGMVAFQFAKTYVLLNQQADNVSKLLDGFEKELNQLLLDMGEAPSEPAQA